MRRWLQMVLLCLCIFSLSACDSLSAEDLYRLPQADNTQGNLQEAVRSILDEGYQILSPAAGSSRAPIQMEDLDGDGQDEAITFFSSKEDSSVLVVILSEKDGVYAESARLHGAGAGISTVSYGDLFGDGSQEILITYQVSESVPYALEIYSWQGEDATVLLSASVSQYRLEDLDSDGCTEVIGLTSRGTELAALCTWYDFGGEGAGQRTELSLSFSYDAILKIRTGTLASGETSLLVTGTQGEITSTDALAADQDGLRQLTSSENLQTSRLGGSILYPDDINQDGVVEFPVADASASGEADSAEDSSSGTDLVTWYTLDAGGTAEKACQTWYDIQDGWYLIYKEAWEDTALVTRDDSASGVTTVTFSRRKKKKTVEILTIYTYRGTGTGLLTEEGAPTVLYQDEKSAYAVEINEEDAAWEGAVSITELSTLFHVISAEDSTAQG